MKNPLKKIQTILTSGLTDAERTELLARFQQWHLENQVNTFMLVNKVQKDLWPQIEQPVMEVVREHQEWADKNSRQLLNLVGDGVLMTAEHQFDSLPSQYQQNVLDGIATLHGRLLQAKH
jgi:hypothetical protein